MRAAPTLPVWSVSIRLLHWTLALAVLVAWASIDASARVHELAGEVALAAAFARVVLGALGRGRVRFVRFVRGPRATFAYLRLVRAGRAPRHLGVNPLGAWMVVASLAAVIAASATGLVFMTDRFWGDPTLAEWHEALAWTVAGLALLHVAGVLATARRQDENLIAAMIVGRKRMPQDGDIE